MDSAYAAAYPELYRRHWWWRVREEILFKRISALFADAHRPLRILDVGCGAGLFFDALQRLGHVEGIESDPIALQHAGKWRQNIFLGQLDGAFTPSARYDLILLLDVLEHLRDPVQLLRCATDLLKRDGRIVITVPSFNWLWTKHDDLNQHVHRYTAGQMHKTLTAAGLTPRDSTYLFQSLVVPKALVRIVEKLLDAPARVPGIPAEPLNSALQAWLRLEYAVAHWLPFGTSLMVVAVNDGATDTVFLEPPAACPPS